MKSINYLYEMDSMAHLFTLDELVVIRKYIDTHIQRAEHLIRSGSMNTAMEVSKRDGSNIFVAQGVVVNKRLAAMDFWIEKKREVSQCASNGATPRIC
jgi:hypothetical protein